MRVCLVGHEQHLLRPVAVENILMNPRYLSWASPMLACMVIVTPTLGGEPWADPDLPKAEGLVLWLDAARQPAAWKAHGKPVLGDGAALDVWYDGSGNGFHL